MEVWQNEFQVIRTLITIFLLFWQENSFNKECGLSALGIVNYTWNGRRRIDRIACPRRAGKEFTYRRDFLLDRS